MKSTDPGSLGRALIACGVALLAACASQQPRGTAANTYAGDEAGKLEESIGDRELEAGFVMINIRTETRDGRLRVQFDLKNTTPADLEVEWAIHWADGSGFQLATSPHWRPAIVAGHGFHAIQAVAPAAEARIWKLALRRPTAIR